MTRPYSEEPACSNLDHANVPLRLVDEEAADMPNLIFMPVDHRPAAEI